MAGIAGILARDRSGQHKASLGAMVERMVYEDFHSSGTYVNEDLGIWAGWVSQHGSFSDCLPAWNESKDVCLIFVGEDFTDPSEIRRLRSNGHAIDPDVNNCSYLVHCYEEFGLGFLDRLNGCFSGLLIDVREKKAVLFNDRYGLVRLYYHESDEGLFFASEAKALLGLFPQTRRLSARGLSEFLSCGAVLQNRTLFEGIHLLPCASAWIARPGGNLARTRYFDPASWETQSSLNAAEYCEQLSETWQQILPRYFRGSGEVALSMTGGVDSRMILAWAPRAPGSLPCYTFGGRYRDCADVKISREAAQICRQPHEVLSIGADFLAKFPALAEKEVFVSDGAMDVSGSVDLYVQTLARRVAPVRLSGVNGGELLRSVVAFKPSPLRSGIFAPDLEELSRQAASTYAGELQPHRLSFIMFKQAPWYMTAKFALERSQLTFRTPYFDNDLVKLAFRVPEALAGSNAPALRLIAQGNPALSKLGTDRGLVLDSVPAWTAAVHAFQQFTFKAEYAYDYGMPQWLAGIDHTLGWMHLEKLFLGRHKFHHFRVFYRDELSAYLKEVLLDPRARRRPYLNGRFLDAMVNDHVQGRRNYTTEIHKVLTCELIQRVLLEAF